MNRFIPVALLAAHVVYPVYSDENPAAPDHGTAEQQTTFASLNPSVSVALDTFYYHENSDDGLPGLKEEMPGFGHAGHEEEDDHEHGVEDGFNLREVEVIFTGELEGILAAEATLAFDGDEAEIETAQVESSDLPGGLKLRAGKFFSDFGIVNAQHPHQWSFSDQPLIYELALGDHGLNEIGVQASWTAPLSFPLTFGVEALQGENERMFHQEDSENLSDHSGPGLGVAWLKTGPNLHHGHTLEFGLFGGAGRHQEIHEEAAGTNDYFDGTGFFAGGDLFYHYDAHKEQGQGDLVLQGEYFYRMKDLDYEASDDPAATPDGQLESFQDGYYLQALYGFLPRWRCGLRWEQTGLTNELQEPGEAEETFGDSWRATAMVDYRPITGTVIRLQANNGDYYTEHGRENAWEVYAQLVVVLGTHAHRGNHSCGAH